MSNHERRPPSGRDFAVFEAVIVGGKSTREAAEQFRVSQTRVCQVVERVREWQAEVLPARSGTPSLTRSGYEEGPGNPQSKRGSAAEEPEQGGDEQRRLQLAKIVAAGRLDHLYGEMMQAWRRSQGEVKKLRSTRFGDDVTTTFFSPGDPKYLLAAMRLATAQAALGAFGGLAYPPDEDDAEGTEGGREYLSPDDLPLGEFVADKDSRPLGTRPPSDTGRPEARPMDGPPAEDCSANGREQPKAAGNAASASVATAVTATHSAALTPQQSAARKQFFGPVQPREWDGQETVPQHADRPQHAGPPAVLTQTLSRRRLTAAGARARA